MAIAIDNFIGSPKFILKISFILTVIHLCLAARLYSIEENEPPRELGSVPKDFNLYARFSNDQLNAIRYTIIKATGSQADYFDVNYDTGVLSTTKILDRETFCDKEIECILNIEIGMYTKRGMEVEKAEVLIVDLNDITPQFPEVETHVIIPESSQIDARFALPIAVDGDSKGPNSNVKYSLGDDNGIFDISVSEFDGNVVDVSLVLRGELDRERLDNYQMKVYAVDRGSPRLTGTMSVAVTVGDINDHKPVFHKRRYEVTVPENQDIGKLLVKVHARDMDKGDNARITYKISSRADKYVQKYLRLNYRSGEITVKRKIDYEDVKIKKFQFTVEARDNGPQPLKAYTTVVINVRDLNDNAPVIHMNYLFRKSRGQFAENSDHKTLVAHFYVSDLDSGERKDVYCKLHDTNFILEAMKGNMYQILLNTQVDRETQAEYTVKLTCIDKGRPPRTVTETIRFTVLDENDFSPKFKKPQYDGVIPENSKLGTSVLTVVASDADIGLNGDIRFKIVGGANLFKINEESGEITSSGVLDRELTPRISFNVYAWDRGKSPLSDVAKVVVDVLDENDETPLFVSNHYIFRVNEKQEGVIGTVNATDRDLGSGGEVTYTIPRYEEGAFFSISPENGAIRSKVILDSNVKKEYNFAVKGSDSGHPIRWSKTKVTVYVEDINDNKPIISPLPNNGTLEIPDNIRPGSLATTVIARDSDSGRNGELTYSIQSSCAGCFSIEKHTGNLFVERLNPMVRMYTVIVTVRDNGVPALRDTTNITIFVVKPQMINLHDQHNYSNDDNQGDHNMIKGENLMIIIGVVVGTVVICGIIVTLICILRHNNNNPAARTPVKTNSGDPAEVKYSDPPVNNANLRPPGCTYKSFRCDSNGEDKLTADMVDNGLLPEGQYQLMCRTKPAWNMDSPRHERNVCPVPPLQHENDYNRTLSHMNTFQMSPNRSLSHQHNDTINIPMTSHKSNSYNNNNAKRTNSAGNLNQPCALYNEFRRNKPDEDHSDTSRDTTNSDSGKGGSEEDSHVITSPKQSHVKLSDSSVKFSAKGVAPDYV